MDEKDINRFKKLRSRKYELSDKEKEEIIELGIKMREEGYFGLTEKDVYEILGIEEALKEIKLAIKNLLENDIRCPHCQRIRTTVDRFTKEFRICFNCIGKGKIKPKHIKGIKEAIKNAGL